MMLKAETTLRFRLRNETAPLHKKVEDRIALYLRYGERDSYVSFLKRMYGLHRPIEDALEQMDWLLTGINFSDRRRHGLIESDLCDFGLSNLEIAQVPLVRDLPHYETIFAGLGALYVLEGSALGGRVILDQLSESLGIGPDFGGRFLSGYGIRSGLMWQSFVHVLNGCGDTDEEANIIINAAIKTFLLFDEWFAN